MKLIFHLQDGRVEEFLIEKNSVIIGRGADCDVVLPFEGFSRRHAQIEFVNGEIFVTDLASTNGVFINGSRVSPNEKHRFQNFLKLQIGPAYEVEVLEEASDRTAPSFNIQNLSSGMNQHKPETPEHTKTIQLEERELKRSPKRHKESRASSEGKSKLPMLIFPIIIIVFAVYYSLNKNGEDAVSAPAPQQVVEVAAPLTEVNFLSSAMLSSLFKDKSCAGPSNDWCQVARILEGSNEGVSIEGKNLVIYLDMSDFGEEKFHEEFEKLEDEKKLEIIALRRIFNSNLLRSFTRQTDFDTLQVVIGVNKKDEFDLVQAFKFMRNLKPEKIDKFFIHDLFDTALNLGKLGVLSDVSALYEKKNL